MNAETKMFKQKTKWKNEYYEESLPNGYEDSLSNVNEEYVSNDQKETTSNGFKISTSNFFEKQTVLQDNEDEELKSRLIIDEEYNGNITIKLVNHQTLKVPFVVIFVFF
jgi:hypothetical protein